MLLDAANIRRLAEQFSQRDEGQLTIATTHPGGMRAASVVTAFKAAFPKVIWCCIQASPSELVRLLQEGEADIGIATEAGGRRARAGVVSVLQLASRRDRPAGAPAAPGPLTLEALADYPLITYHHGFTGAPASTAPLPTPA